MHHLAQLLDEKGAPPELQQREGGAEEDGQPQRAVALSFALRERQLQHRAHVRHVAAPDLVRVRVRVRVSVSVSVRVRVRVRG